MQKISKKTKRFSVLFLVIFFSKYSFSQSSSSSSPAKIDCKWARGAVDEMGVLPDGAAPEWQAYEVLMLSCKALDSDASNLNLSLIGSKDCSGSSSGICIEKNTIPSSLSIQSSDYTALGYVLLKNANVTSNQEISLSKGTIGVTITQGDSKDNVEVSA
jgi:hypothetical protein